jgi:hypothetical protein
MNRNDYPTYGRIQQQQEEQPRMEYPIEHPTYFSNKYGYRYTAIVEVYSNKTVINLYKTTPALKLKAPSLVKMFLSLLDAPNDDDPICNPRTISNTTSVHYTIKDMVVEYEMPLYNKWMAEELAGKLQIDYEAELRNRRQRLTNIDQEPATQTTYQPVAVNIWDEQQEPELTDEQKREQQIQEIAKRTGKSEGSIRSLAQFRDSKKLG